MSSNALHTDIEADKALHEDIATETFEQCEKLMYQYVWKFYNRYGGSFDDWVGEGHLIFMKCLNTYSNQFAFTTWFSFKLQMGFITVIRKKLRATQPKIKYDTELTETQYPTYHTTFLNNCEHVSDRAWAIWQVLLAPPHELDNELDENDPTNTLDAIMWYGTTKLQWTKSQVLESLTELWECSQL